MATVLSILTALSVIIRCIYELVQMVASNKKAEADSDKDRVIKSIGEAIPGDIIDLGNGSVQHVEPDVRREGGGIAL